MAQEETLPQPPRLLQQVREKIRYKHYSIRTESSYVDWIKRFIFFHDRRHPRDMGAPEIERFLTHLAVEGKVAASTQNQAKSALLFLYREVLGIQLPWLDDIESAKTPKRLPVVLTKEEVLAILLQMEGRQQLIGRLLYGTGMRILECLRLRVKDVDFARSGILIRDGKGFKDRVTMLPRALHAPLQAHLRAIKVRIRGIWPRASARSICCTRWIASIRGVTVNGDGSMCFPLQPARWILVLGLYAAIT